MICWGTKRRKAILGDTSKEMKKELNTFTHSFNMYCVPTLRQAREKKKKSTMIDGNSGRQRYMVVMEIIWLYADPQRPD